jgi:hypothetical protein
VAVTSRPTSRRISRLAAVAAGLALIAAACGGSDAATPVDTAPAADADAETVSAANESDPAAQDDTADAPVGAIDAVPAVLQFTAPLVGGGDIDAVTLADKPTAFWFWAPT